MNLLSLLRLASAPVLPYEFGGLVRTLRGYADEIHKEAGENSKNVDLQPVYAELSKMESGAKDYEDALAAAQSRLTDASVRTLAKVNETLFRTERALLASDGLPKRDWYKHELYAPGLYTGYGAKTLPGIREAVEGSRWPEANEQALKVAAALKAFNAQVDEATRLLRGLDSSNSGQ